MSARALTLLALAACGAAAKAPASFLVEFDTDVKGDGKFVVNVTTAWAPNGAQHFYDLVNDGFYDEAAFTRVVPNFVVQFGIAGEPAENEKWAQAIQDDPVTKSNVKGTMTYAATGAPNSRTTQIFVNTVNNGFLDDQGFAPFAEVVKGMDVVAAITNPTPGSSGGIDQGAYTQKGNAWLRKNYPTANFVTKAKVVESL